MDSYSFLDPLVRRSNCSPRVEAYYSRTWEHYDMVPHYHDRAEIMYTVKGSGLIHLYDYKLESEGKKILISRHWTERLPAGEFMLLDRMVLHRLEVPEECFMLNLEFVLTEDQESPVDLGRLAASSRDLMELLTKGNRITCGKDRTGKLHRAMEQTIQELPRAIAGEQALSKLMMAEVLLCLAEASRDSSQRDNALCYARKAVDYIAGHLDENIRIADVAAAVGVAPAYLQRVFRQNMGLTIIEYLNRLRVEQSKRLLMFTDDPVMDVAIASGFNSRQHFFRVFQTETGMSPRDFRKNKGDTNAQTVYKFAHAEDYSYDDELNLLRKK